MFATGKYAAAICDRCGLRYRYSELSEQFEHGRRIGLMVCARCNDKENEQDDIGRISFPDPQALRHPRPEPDLRAVRSFFGWSPVSGFEVVAEVGKVSGGIS